MIRAPVRIALQRRRSQRRVRLKKAGLGKRLVAATRRHKGAWRAAADGRRPRRAGSGGGHCGVAKIMTISAVIIAWIFLICFLAGATKWLHF